MSDRDDALAAELDRLGPSETRRIVCADLDALIDHAELMAKFAVFDRELTGHGPVKPMGNYKLSPTLNHRTRRIVALIGDPLQGARRAFEEQLSLVIRSRDRSLLGSDVSAELADRASLARHHLEKVSRAFDHALSSSKEGSGAPLKICTAS